jgi:hypothetical protein
MAFLEEGGAYIPPDLLQDSSDYNIDKNYFDVVVTDLELNSPYSFQFAWVYEDKTVSQYSANYTITTSDEDLPKAPNFLSEHLVEANGFLKITWDGKDYTGNNLTAIKQVNIWIKGGTYGSSYVNSGKFLNSAGTSTIALSPGSYSVKLQSESMNGKLSVFSAEQTAIATKGPTPISALTATWKLADGVTKSNALRVTFDFDSTITSPTNSNLNASDFIITLTPADGIVLDPQSYNLPVDRLKGSHIWNLLYLQNLKDFKYPFCKKFLVSVKVKDSFGLFSTSVSITSDIYSTPLNRPQLTPAAEILGYSLSYNMQDNIDQIYVYEDTGSGWTQVAQGRSNPIRISTLTTASRQVKALFYDQTGAYTADSDIVTIVPNNPDPADSTAPSVPTITAGTATYNTIPVTVTTSDISTKGYKVRYKKSGDALYSTFDLPYSGASTTSTLVGLIPNSTYLIGVASYDAYNNISAYSTDISKITQSQTVSPVTNLLPSAISYGLLATWTAPVSPPTSIYNYKIELYNSVNTLLETQYSFSTNASFSGLKPSTTYYVKVYAIDVYGVSSAFVTSSNLTLNANGGSTDGNPPSTHPTPIVKSLFKALSVNWTAVSNLDKVTYHVHIGTTSTFTMSATTKVIETDGTFAVIKTSNSTGTDLAFDTDYYIKIVATDADTTTPYAPTVTASSAVRVSRVDSGDVAANAILANNIIAGAITSDKVTAGNLLVNKLFTVGGKTAVVTGATVSGVAPNQIITYTTSGAHGFTALSLVNITGLAPTTFNISGLQITTVPTTSTFTVLNTVSATGSANAGSGTAVAVGSSAIKIDSTGDGITLPFKLFSGTGVYANSNTPFYLDTNAKFSLKDKLYFDGTSLTVNGAIQAQSGYFAGAISVNGVGSVMKFGPAVGGTGNHGIYINQNSYWYDNGNFAIGAASGSSAITLTGTALSVTGAINATSGTITGNFGITTGTLTAGASSTTGARINISSSGMFVYDAGSTTNANSWPTPNLTTAILANAPSGTQTFRTVSALIGNWTVDSNSIFNNGITFTAPPLITSKPSIAVVKGAYSVIIQTPDPTTPAASDIVLWAGNTAGGSDSASFKVQANGKLFATDGTFSGSIIGSDFQTTNYALNPGSGIKITKASPGGTDAILFNKNGVQAASISSTSAEGFVINAEGYFMAKTTGGYLNITSAEPSAGIWLGNTNNQLRITPDGTSFLTYSSSIAVFGLKNIRATNALGAADASIYHNALVSLTTFRTASQNLPSVGDIVLVYAE